MTGESLIPRVERLGSLALRDELLGSHWKGESLVPTDNGL